MKNVLLILVLVIATSCKQNNSGNLVDMDWLVGNWHRVNQTEGEIYLEEWKKISATEYVGQSFVVKHADTIGQEMMSLLFSDGSWSLFVRMPAEAESTEFRASEIDEEDVTFENQEVDFPNKIRYFLKDKRLKAVISNEEMEVPFIFEKND